MEKTHIVIAEPKELLRKVLADRFSIENFQVYEAVNGEELLDLMTSVRVDIIVAEELLPFKNGVEIIKDATRLNIPVIIISDADLESKILEAFELGASDFIDKPFSPNEVVARVKNVLRKK